MHNKIHQHGSFRIGFPILAAIIGYLLILLFNNNIGQLYALFLSQELYLFVITSFLLFEILRFSQNLYIKRKGFKGDSFARIGLQLLLSCGITIFIALLTVHVYFYYFVHFSPAVTLIYSFCGIFILLNLLFQAIWISARFLSLENESKIHSEILEFEALDGALSKFKEEMNPGLLQISLERTMQLCHENPEEAELMIDQLSTCYRHVVTNSKSYQPVSLMEDYTAALATTALLSTAFYCTVDLKLIGSIESQKVSPGTLPSIIQGVFDHFIFEPGKQYSICISIGQNGTTIQWNNRKKIKQAPRNFNYSSSPVKEDNKTEMHSIFSPFIL